MSTTDATAHAGWYAVGGGYERFWDGTAWTDRVRPVPAYVGVAGRTGLLARLTAFVTHVPITPN
jgi:hypothetical protein